MRPHRSASSHSLRSTRNDEKWSAVALELRSEGVQEVLGRIPPWIIRYGITVIFGLILLLLFLAWMIRYPDVINATGTLSSLDPPREVLARADGRLVLLKVTDGQDMDQGTTLAVIESAASPSAMDSLRGSLPELHAFLADQRDSVPPFGDLQLGAVQRSWAEARALASELHRWRKDPYREKRYAALRKKIELYQRMIRSTEGQLAWSKRRQENALAESAVDTSLMRKGVMATSEFRTRQNAFIEQQMNMAALEGSLHQNRITLVELEAQLNDQLFTDESKLRELEQRLLAELNGLQAFADGWRMTNELTAPRAGRVHFASRLNVGQPVKNGDLLFRVVTDDQTYVVEAVLPSGGSAKVKAGQAAYVRLEGFPAEEFGRLIGTVRVVALLPGDEGYRVQVDLPQGLTTSFHRTLPFRPEMMGTVEVVTRDRSVLGRIFDRLRGTMDR